MGRLEDRSITRVALVAAGILPADPLHLGRERVSTPVREHSGTYRRLLTAMVFVKTFVIFVPFVFQFADPATTVNEPKAMGARKRRGALCASVSLW